MTKTDDIQTCANVQAVAEFLRSWRFNFGTEKELQDGIWHAFNTEWGDGTWHREYVLSEKERIDFFYEATGVGVECKIDHALSALTRQVHGYVQHESICGLVLVTSKARLSSLPERISGKPIRIVNLIGSIL